MKIIQVNTWNEVKEAFRQIEEERSLIEKELDRYISGSEFLYRGQGNSNWSMQTTLERASSEPILLSEYYRHVLITRPQVEAFSNNRWELMSINEYEKWAASKSDLAWPGDFPGYEYMIYLRHHGFPSPLMDWTTSPYVAAYFAYKKIPNDADSIAIYCYCEHIGLSKSWTGGEPTIVVKGPYARSHRRHFLQRCKYTVCANRIDRGLCYISHEEVFKKNHQTQDLLWKIVVPSSTVKEALKDLDTMNVNAFSLMGSEDSLVQTMAARLYEFGDDGI